MAVLHWSHGATGMARSTISRGIQELESGEALNPDRARRPGGGRKRTIDKDIALLADLEALLDPTTAGWPDAPLRWTSKSTRKLAAELQAMGHTVSHRLVAALLRDLGYTCKRIERPAKARNIPIGTLSSSISTTRCLDVRSGGAR